MLQPNVSVSKIFDGTYNGQKGVRFEANITADLEPGTVLEFDLEEPVKGARPRGVGSLAIGIGADGTATIAITLREISFGEGLNKQSGAILPPSLRTSAIVLTPDLKRALEREARVIYRKVFDTQETQ